MNKTNLAYGIIPLVAKKLYESLNDDDFRPLKAKYGDVIGVRRGHVPGTRLQVYKHYGVYVGRNRVVHFAHDSKNILRVHEAPMKEFLEGEDEYFVCHFPEEHGRPSEIDVDASMFPSNIRIPDVNLYGRFYNLFKSNEHYRLYTPQSTVRRARSKIGQTEYNLLLNNCEHFAIWCKTGISESHQVDDLLDILLDNIININFDKL